MEASKNENFCYEYTVSMKHVTCVMEKLQNHEQWINYLLFWLPTKSFVTQMPYALCVAGILSLLLNAAKYIQLGSNKRLQ